MVMRKKKEGQPEAPTAADYGVLVKPVITEKSSMVSGAQATVVFKVDARANKHQIRNAIERVFKTRVDAVRTCTYKGKLKRTTRSIGRRAGFKKAYITLKPGHTIDLVEGL